MEVYAVKSLDISKESLDKLCLSIDSSKRCRIERFINKQDKINTLLGEILIRNIIIKALKIANKNITFVKNEYGKPSLKDNKNFHFNISHCEDFVACAVDDKPIGVDIEKVQSIEYEEIAKRFFTMKEYDYMVKDSQDSSLRKFYEIWTLKESYIKCRGKGLSIPLKSFSIAIDQDENIKVITKNKESKYTFKKFDMELDYKMAVCALNKEISNNIIRVEQNRLINNYLELL